MSLLSRRRFLRASGITLALPWLEAFAAPKAGAAAPRRFCAIYFPFGVSLPGQDSPDAKWNWFPHTTGKDYQFNESLQGLAPYRDQLSILGGLQHPLVVKSGGHSSADSFLTGAAMNPASLQNSVSVDQIVASHAGNATRFPSLTMSSDGGVGLPMTATTLSFNKNGDSVPALNRPAFIFERLFGMNRDSIEDQRKGLAATGSHLDMLLDDARALNARLGKSDQDKLDAYFTSVRQLEERVERSAQWLTVPKAKVNATGLTLDADAETPRELIHTMLDLIVLAFQTDTTRAATYQLGSMGNTVNFKFSQILGFGDTTHGLAHKWNKPGGAEKLGKWDQWQADNLAYFLGKLAAIQEGDGTLLDNTTVLYGSSNSYTHANVNYPLVLAGGRSMGLRHGSYQRFDAGVPLCNLYLTLLHRMGIETGSFGDSNGELTQLTT